MRTTSARGRSVGAGRPGGAGRSGEGAGRSGKGAGRSGRCAKYSCSKLNRYVAVSITMC